MQVNGTQIRVVRTPWRLGAYPDGFQHKAPAEEEEIGVGSA
jgi:hypothetical protein